MAEWLHLRGLEGFCLQREWEYPPGPRTEPEMREFQQNSMNFLPISWRCQSMSSLRSKINKVRGASALPCVICINSQLQGTGEKQFSFKNYIQSEYHEWNLGQNWTVQKSSSDVNIIDNPEWRIQTFNHLSINKMKI